MIHTGPKVISLTEYDQTALHLGKTSHLESGRIIEWQRKLTFKRLSRGSLTKNTNSSQAARQCLCMHLKRQLGILRQRALMFPAPDPEGEWTSETFSLKLCEGAKNSFVKSIERLRSDAVLQQSLEFNHCRVVIGRDDLGASAWRPELQSLQCSLCMVVTSALVKIAKFLQSS